MRKKVAITGTAGFIGYHLALSLAKDGCEVSGWDNFNSYYSPALKEARAAQLKALNVNVHRGDLCDADGLRAWVEGFEPTHIVHLAAQAGVRYSLDNPQAYIASNIEGFVNVLEIGRSMPTIPIIYASSSSVYGLNTKTPFSVEDRCDQQASLYGVSKKTNELLAHAYHHLYQLPLTGLRFFTVYGPWG
ncbi:MAG: GDP-mannose 4,6-dehydratase, partial [Chlamydiia bacterium]|nr:GDP-mannose 4,6-dehydratase [Chlamydiia bacterium]